MSEDQPFMKIAEFAKATTLSKQSVLKLIREGKLRNVRLGGRTVILKEELHRIIEEARNSI